MCICHWCSRPTPGYKTKQTERVTVCVSILLPESQFYLSIAVKRLNRRRDLQLGNLSRHKNRHFSPSIRLNVVYWWWILIGGWNKENKNKNKNNLSNQIYWDNQAPEMNQAAGAAVLLVVILDPLIRSSV